MGHWIRCGANVVFREDNNEAYEIQLTQFLAESTAMPTK